MLTALSVQSRLRSTHEERLDVLMVGDAGSVARALIEPLAQLGLTSKQLADPTDGELIDELRSGVGAVAVVTRDDALALRLTLLAAHVGS